MKFKYNHGMNVLFLSFAMFYSIVLSGPVCAASGFPQYEFFDIPPLPNASYCIAESINDNGYVAGYCAIGEGKDLKHHLFLYDGRDIHDLYTFDVFRGTREYKIVMNNRNQIAFTDGYSGNSGLSTAHIYANGVVADLGVSKFCYSGADPDCDMIDGQTYVYDMNDSGQIVGFTNNGGHGAGYIYSDGRYIVIDITPYSHCQVNCISSNGQVAGWASDPVRFFVGTPGAIQYTDINLDPRVINSKGSVIGTELGSTSGVLFQNGGITRLDYTPLFLNDNDFILGRLGEYNTVLCKKNDCISLDELSINGNAPWVTGMNNSLLIAGYRFSGGSYQAVIGRPIKKKLPGIDLLLLE